MPTLFTHAVVPIAWRVATRRQPPSGRAVAAAIALTLLPDADVIAFVLGIPYGSPFGHRGFTHSVAFAAIAALLAAIWLQPARGRRGATVLFLFVAAVSHPLLDALTDGGLGVALLWPWSDARWFAPWRPLSASPIGPGFFSRQGLAVIVSELLWLWLPLAVLVTALRWRR